MNVKAAEREEHHDGRDLNLAGPRRIPLVREKVRTSSVTARLTLGNF